MKVDLSSLAKYANIRFFKELTSLRIRLMESVYDRIIGFHHYLQFVIEKPELVDLIKVVGVDRTKVYKSTKIVMACGLSRFIPHSVIVWSKDNELVIVVNDRFTKEPDWFQDAMLFHEIGHINLHIFTTIPIINKSESVRLMMSEKGEFEADIYARDTDILKALYHLQELGCDVNRRIAYAEYIRRLRDNRI